MLTFFTPLLQLLQTHLVAWYLTAICLGAIVGSFIAATVLRLIRWSYQSWYASSIECLLEHNTPPSALKTALRQLPPGSCTAAAFLAQLFSRSSCPKCQMKIPFYYNIPLLGFLRLRGRCSYCQQSISSFYFWTELSTIGITLGLAVFFGCSISFLAAALFAWFSLSAALIDAKTQLLPDEITWPLLALGLLFSLSGVFVSPQESIIGALFGYYILWGTYWVFFALTRKEGFGFGDFRLLAAQGAWLGWTMIPQIILLASLSALLLSIIDMLYCRFKKPACSSTAFLQRKLAFGPHLALAGVIALIWGTQINQAYLHLLIW